MALSLSISDARPEQNSDAACGQNIVHFYFEIATDDYPNDQIYDIDWDTVDISFKRDGGTYELLVDDGEVVSKQGRYAYIQMVAIQTGEAATGYWPTGQCRHHGFFKWTRPMSFPDGRKFWIKIQLDDVMGNSYSEEWYFVVRAVTYAGPAQLSLLKRTASSKASQRFGPCAYGQQATLQSALTWAVDNDSVPTVYELWVEPVYIPADVAVSLTLGLRNYSPVQGTWIKLETDLDFDNGLPFEGGDSMDIEVRVVSSKAQTARDYLRFRFLAFGYGITGALQTGLCPTGHPGIGLLDELSVDFSMYCMSQQTTDYYRDDLGMTVTAS